MTTSVTVYLAPAPINQTQFIPGGNQPASGAQLFFYQAGTSTKQATYTTSSGNVANSNPIILDSGGNVSASHEVWFAGGQTYDAVLAPSTDSDPPVSPYWTAASLTGINDPGVTLSEWVASGSTATFVNASTFTITGDVSGILTYGRRLRTVNTGGTLYSTVTSSVFSASTTTLGIQSDSTGLDAGLSSISYGVINPKNTSLPDFVHINNFGPAGDDSTDDNVPLQRFLNQGGKLILGGARTYKNTAANLTLVSNTDLTIERGTTLHLVSTRLTALNVNDVYIHNNGIIKSTNINTTDALPTDWLGRGIVEFGGTSTNPSQRVGISGPGEVLGDFSGTPGTITISANDRRRGIAFNHVSTAIAFQNKVHNTIGEGIWFFGVSTSANILIESNNIHDGNHDAISPACFAPITFVTKNNLGSNCLNGIEASIGVHSGNIMSNMVGAGYSLGGSPISEAASPLIFYSNTGINNGNSGNGSVDFSMSPAPNSTTGILVLDGNISISSGTHGFAATFNRINYITNNKAYGWGQTSTGSAFTWSNNISTFVDNNTISNEGANSNGGFNFNGLTIWGFNTYSGVTTPYVGGSPTTTTGSLVVNGTITITTSPALILTGQNTGVGASTATFTNSLHAGNPTIWPRISINGSTLCFPCFATT